MGTAREYFGLTALNNNLYAVGGRDEDNNCLTTSERYDPDLDSWTPIASMGTARASFGTLPSPVTAPLVLHRQ